MEASPFFAQRTSMRPRADVAAVTRADCVSGSRQPRGGNALHSAASSGCSSTSPGPRTRGSTPSPPSDEDAALPASARRSSCPTRSRPREPAEDAQLADRDPHPAPGRLEVRARRELGRAPARAHAPGDLDEALQRAQGDLVEAGRRERRHARPDQRLQRRVVDRELGGLDAAAPPLEPRRSAGDVDRELRVRDLELQPIQPEPPEQRLVGEQQRRVIALHAQGERWLFGGGHRWSGPTLPDQSASVVPTCGCTSAPSNVMHGT
jgi:hypothetical protein